MDRSTSECADSQDPEAAEPRGETVSQPIVAGVRSADLLEGRCPGSYLGTDCGVEGTGMWHSLSGFMEDKDDCLDLARCFPLVRPAYQPRCVGARIRAQGAGSVKLELRSADGRVLWWATQDLLLGEGRQELNFSWDPAKLNRVKSLHWETESGVDFELESLELEIRMPRLPFEQEVFLVSYAKLARLYSPDEGTVRERAPQSAGRRDCTAAAGLFCLATAAAYKMGLVKRAQADQILRKISGTVAEIPRVSGLLPMSTCKEEGVHTVARGSTYSVLHTSLYYHGVLLAAQLLWDGKTLANTINAVREIDFSRLRDSEEYVAKGLSEDGKTLLDGRWCDWGGETALVMLLESMATGHLVRPELNGVGKVRGGVGLSAEIGSLFYPDFSADERDTVTRVNWREVRRAHLDEQRGYFPRKRPRSAATRMGLYGLSLGEDPDGEGYVVAGTDTGPKEELIRPHYILMSGLVERHPVVTYHALRTMKDTKLLSPWGMVGGFSRKLEPVPLVGSFSAGLECIASYHLLKEATGGLDHIYAAAEDCGLTREAIRALYPAIQTW